MTKLKDFDYERYLAGDKVIYEDGRPFEGEVFFSKIRNKECPKRKYTLIVVNEYGSDDSYTIDGYNHFEKRRNEDNLKMAPKTTTWYIGILYPLKKENEKYTKMLTSDLYLDKAELEATISNGRKPFDEIIEIELEE